MSSQKPGTVNFEQDGVARCNAPYRGGIQNAILLALILAVVAVTTVNQYTAQKNLADVAATQTAQEMGSKALCLARYEAGINNELREQLGVVVQQRDSLFLTVIELQELLETNNIPLPSELSPPTVVIPDKET